MMYLRSNYLQCGRHGGDVNSDGLVVCHSDACLPFAVCDRRRVEVDARRGVGRRRTRRRR